MTEDDEILICTKCVKDKRYKRLIETIGNRGICTCCETKGIVINQDSNEFIQMTKALVRYHYSEWDYNHHFGGVSFINFFSPEDNIFFKKQNFKNLDVYEELLCRIESIDAYGDMDNGVSLYAGYLDGQQIPLLDSLKSILDSSILKIQEKLKTENYFKYENNITSMLSEYAENCKIIIKKKSEFFRARVGFAHKKIDFQNLSVEVETVYEPYSGSNIGAPPPHLAGDGRINRVGVSYLYCATDKYTATAEIRPHPGDIVSIGKFIAIKDLLIFDLTANHFVKYYYNDHMLHEYRKLNTFTELLQKVITPSERRSYNITQLIADCIRKLNFDGILFPSSISDEDNLVVFNPENMEYTWDEAQVIEIKKVNYDYLEKRSVDDINIIKSIF